MLISHFLYTFSNVTNFQNSIGKSMKTQSLVQWVSQIWASLTWLRFEFHRLKLISTTAPAASKNEACFKSGQKWREKNYIACYSKSVTHSVVPRLKIRCSLHRKSRTTNKMIKKIFRLHHGMADAFSIQQFMTWLHLKKW